MSDPLEVTYVVGASNSTARERDTVLFVMQRADAHVLINVVNALVHDEPMRVQADVMRRISMRLHLSYLADRVVVATDLSLSYSVLANALYLVDRWTGLMLSPVESMPLRIGLGQMLRALELVIRRTANGRRRPNIWTQLETRLESPN